jgi:hypothetical protein
MEEAQDLIKKGNLLDSWSQKLKSKIVITVLSDLEYENLLAEILIDGQFIGLVTNEPDRPVCFEVPEGELKFQSLDLEVLQEALAMAKKELLQE